MSTSSRASSSSSARWLLSSSSARVQLGEQRLALGLVVLGLRALALLGRRRLASADARTRSSASRRARSIRSSASGCIRSTSARRVATISVRSRNRAHVLLWPHGVRHLRLDRLGLKRKPRARVRRAGSGSYAGSGSALGFERGLGFETPPPRVRVRSAGSGSNAAGSGSTAMLSLAALLGLREPGERLALGGLAQLDARRPAVASSPGAGSSPNAAGAGGAGTSGVTTGSRSRSKPRWCPTAPRRAAAAARPARSAGRPAARRAWPPAWPAVPPAWRGASWPCPLELASRRVAPLAHLLLLGLLAAAAYPEGLRLRRGRLGRRLRPGRGRERRAGRRPRGQRRGRRAGLGGAGIVGVVHRVAPNLECGHRSPPIVP